MTAPSAELAHGWASSGWVIGMLPIHLGQTSSTSSSIAATKRASTEGGPFGTSMCLLTPTPEASWESLNIMEYGVQGRFLLRPE